MLKIWKTKEKKKQNAQLRRHKNFILTPEVSVYIVFGPCSFLILYIISKLYFYHTYSLSLVRRERKPYEKKRRREKVVEKSRLNHKNINLDVNKFVWKNRVQIHHYDILHWATTSLSQFYHRTTTTGSQYRIIIYYIYSN
jgi:hypothetical protein